MVSNCVCPCCGAPIKPGQEACTNCLVYLWEVVNEENND
jgi:hypothetical protein